MALGLREWHWGPKKSRFSGPTPSNGPSNGFAHIKIIYVPCYINNRALSGFEGCVKI
jgi:hypothetical protein